MCERIGIETCTTTSIVTPSSVNYNARVSSRKSGLVLSSVDLFREPASSNNASSFFSPRLVIASDLSLSLLLHEIERSPQRRQERTGIIERVFLHFSRRRRRLVITSDLSYTTSRGPRRLDTARRCRCFAPNTSRRVPSVLHTGWPARRSHSRYSRPRRSCAVRAPRTRSSADP